MTDPRRQREAHREAKISCFICKTEEPLATANDHHRKPRAFGGTDDPLNRVWLCASCHTRLHRVQEFLVQGKVSAAYDLCAAIFTGNATARGELWLLANEAAEAEREVGESFGMHQTHTKVTLSVDVETWAAVKFAAKGRKTSAKNLAAEIIRHAVAKGL